MATCKAIRLHNSFQTNQTGQCTNTLQRSRNHNMSWHIVTA